MLVTDHFVFLHLHKSGGTFLNRIICRFFPEAQLLGYHFPRHKLPQQYCHLPLIGCVRNPWDYYVSWYSFQQQLPQPGPLFQIISNQGKNDFNTSIEKLLTLGEDETLFHQFQETLPKHFSNRGLNLTQTSLEPIKGSSLGFYSFLYQHIFGQAQDVHFMRMENLREECLNLLQQLEVPISKQFIFALENMPKKNTSLHRHYSDYYNIKMRDKIGHYDQSLIQRFKYEYTKKLDKKTANTYNYSRDNYPNK